MVVLKSFGKFWALQGYGLVSPSAIRISSLDYVRPWGLGVSGPALEIGAEALADPDWADETRGANLDAIRLDQLLTKQGAQVGGTPLFRLYEVENALDAQHHLAKSRIWSRTFPYKDMARLGIPNQPAWRPHFDAICCNDLDAIFANQSDGTEYLIQR